MICFTAIVMTMTYELSFAEEISFKFKEGNTLNDLVSAFCDYFEEQNPGHWPIKKASLMPGKLVAVQVSREWLIGGIAVALILFFSEEDDSGRAVAYIYSWNSSDRPIHKLSEQIHTIFHEKCDELIQVESHGQPGAREEAEPEATTAGRQPQGWLTPIRFCEKCAAAIAIDESTFCWNCGAKLPVGEKKAPLYYGEETPRSRPQCDEIEYDRNCMICKLDFKDGQLLAWCPHCGAPAHRIHMLEWLHVKGTCPACGQHLATPELEEQLSQAHFQQQKQAQPHAKARTTRKTSKR